MLIYATLEVFSDRISAVSKSLSVEAATSELFSTRGIHLVPDL
jgi:hypothetical protein